ncbi:MAG: hypothetical protein Q9204_000518 [Flavoplaca sp. TL-2023a]
MTKKIDKDGLKTEIPSHFRTGASLPIGSPAHHDDRALASPADPGAHQHEHPQAQQENVQDTNGDHRIVLEVYADGEGCLKLATTSVIKNGEKVIIDAVAPLVQEHNTKYFGPRSYNVHGKRRSPYNQKRGSAYKASASSVKCRNASSNLSSASPVNSVKGSPPADNINTYGNDDDDEEDQLEHSDHDDDDDGEPLLEIQSEHFDMLSAGDVKALEDYYTKGVCQIGQVLMKKVLKSWVKVKHPKKQSLNPYNGGKTREDQEQEKRKRGQVDPNPGKLTAPDWWPRQDGWPYTGCRHKEPDHLRKQERTILALKMLSMTGCDEVFTVDKLIDSTMEIEMTLEQKRMLKQLYNVRRAQQKFEDGEIDASAGISVFRPKEQPSQKKRRVNSGRKRNTRRIKREKRSTSAAVEKSTAGTPASMSGSIRSFGSSSTSLAMTKMESQCPTTDYDGYLQAQFAPREEGLQFDAMMPEPTGSYGTMYTAGEQFQPFVGTYIQEIPPCTHPTSAMEVPMACAPCDRGRMPFRSGNRYRRRPTSVCKQNSPSYQDGAIPRRVGWDLNDDLYYDIRPPLTSSGYPTAGLSIALNDPRNHHHSGLSPDEQERICLRHGCDNYRTLEQHQAGALMNGWQLSFNTHQDGISQPHGLPLSFDDTHGGVPQAHGQQLPHFHGQPGGDPHSRSLDVGDFTELMRHEDLTSASSLTRSFGQE